MNARITLALVALCIVSPSSVMAAKWLKVTPDDPYASKDSRHFFDIDSGMEDAATGFVYARMNFVSSADASTDMVKGWYVWAYDCGKNTVYFTSDPGADGTGTVSKTGWQKDPHVMTAKTDAVTRGLGRKLCALKGSWPKGDLPK